VVRRALGFIALNGPSTDQDCWEETPGVNAFTLAVAIAALVCGAELLPHDERRARFRSGPARRSAPRSRVGAIDEWYNARQLESFSILAPHRIAREKTET
jgi:hypothetical protein